jgi:hypothetical protein
MKGADNSPETSVIFYNSDNLWYAVSFVFQLCVLVMQFYKRHQAEEAVQFTFFYLSRQTFLVPVFLPTCPLRCNYCPTLCDEKQTPLLTETCVMKTLLLLAASGNETGTET